MLSKRVEDIGYLNLALVGYRYSVIVICHIHVLSLVSNYQRSVIINGQYLSLVNYYH